jgi:hypothetical protein
VDTTVCPAKAPGETTAMKGSQEMSNQDIDQIRGQVNGVIERAKTDAKFLEQLKNDTAGTLRAAGLPEAAANEASEQMGFGAEVSGYLKCTWTCDRYSCIVTLCGNVPFSN